LKVDTTNSLSLPFILSNRKPRLIIITGKGGVGKTTLAMGITKALEAQGENVLYNCFDQPLNHSLTQNLALPHFTLEMESSAKEYISRKLGSETIAGWILKTPFFKSLFNMLPGLGHMILLGHIITRLEEDPSLTIVLDSPSSGHALTMFESPRNFKDMFRSGLIVEDINRMENFIFNEELMEVVITALPTKMAIQEAKDLEASLKERGVKQFTRVINDLLSQASAVQEATSEDLPEFLEKKISLEKNLLEELSPDDNWMTLPHFVHNKPASIVKEASLFIQRSHKAAQEDK
jgi:arsenite-transporting ATPase